MPLRVAAASSAGTRRGIKLGRFDREEPSSGLPSSLGTATRDLRTSVEEKLREIVEAAEARAHEIEDRFRKEARLAGRLQHPNIVTIYDVGRDGDVFFIAMEYVDGRPLTRYLMAADELPESAADALDADSADMPEDADMGDSETPNEPWRPRQTVS